MVQAEQDEARRKRLQEEIARKAFDLADVNVQAGNLDEAWANLQQVPPNPRQNIDLDRVVLAYQQRGELEVAAQKAACLQDRLGTRTSRLEEIVALQFKSGRTMEQIGPTLGLLGRPATDVEIRLSIAAAVLNQGKYYLARYDGSDRVGTLFYRLMQLVDSYCSQERGGQIKDELLTWMFDQMTWPEEFNPDTWMDNMLGRIVFLRDGTSQLEWLRRFADQLVERYGAEVVCSAEALRQTKLPDQELLIDAHLDPSDGPNEKQRAQLYKLVRGRIEQPETPTA